ncbi:MAG: AI-2E family transporter [Patescibacteria group bacterium]|nr:AI-2E family transporter [Patescibacteria group bacterium]
MQKFLDRKVVFDVSYATFLRAVLIVLLLMFLFAVKDILLLIFVALVIASGLDPVVDWLQKKRIPRGISSLFLFLILLGLIALVVYLLVPPLIEQTRQLVEVLPGYFQTVFEKVSEFTGYSQEQSLEKAKEILTSLEDKIGGAASSVYDFFSSLFGGILSIVMIFVLSFYFIVEEGSFKKFIRSIVPFRHRPYVEDLVGRMQLQVGKWLRGQLLLGLIVGVVIYIGLSLMGVKYALVLALVAGILEVVPYIGPVISAIPAVLIASAQSPLLALLVVILYFLVQQLENHLLVPKIMQKVVGLNPLVIILVILVAVKLAGVLGAIVAVPAATLISVFLKDMFDERDKKDEDKLKTEICEPKLAGVKVEKTEITKRTTEIPPEKKDIE